MMGVSGGAMTGKPIQGVGKLGGLPGGMRQVLQAPRMPGMPAPPSGVATMGPRMPMPILRRK